MKYCQVVKNHFKIYFVLLRSKFNFQALPRAFIKRIDEFYFSKLNQNVCSFHVSHENLFTIFGHDFSIWFNPFPAGTKTFPTGKT